MNGMWKPVITCKKKERTIVKIFNRKDCLHIIRVKKHFKSLDPTELEFPENTKSLVNESLCPYQRGIWNECKKLRAAQKIKETGLLKITTHKVDLKELFPDRDIENL